jgi:hypothetical protein
LCNFLTWEKVSIGIALKASANYFDKYYFYYRITKQDYTYDRFYYESQFRYKWAYTLEPALKIEFYKKLFFQFSGIFSSNAQSVQQYRDHVSHEGKIIWSKPTSKTASPQHIYFLGAVGYTIRF